jgi:thiamine biosynthesis lipoprotein
MNGPMPPAAPSRPEAAPRWGMSSVHHEEEVMGTVVTIDIHLDAHKQEAAELVRDACYRLHEADRIFSIWLPDSPVSRLRRREMALVDGPAEVSEMVELCAVARRHSWGWFDPWAMPGGFDPTGYVKGWAAQRALQVLERPGVRGALVNAAGDVATFGSIGGEAFRIGVVDPRDRRHLACVARSPGAVATSGSYERGAHLIDPNTGLPARAVASATVCGPELGLADALATGLAVAGPPGLAFVQALEGYEALTIDDDGRWQWTANFPFADASSSPRGVQVESSLPPSPA